MDPNERLTAVEALADPYFDGMRDAEVERIIKEQLGSNANTHGSQAQIRQESSKSRSSMRSNTVEREGAN